MVEVAGERAGTLGKHGRGQLVGRSIDEIAAAIGPLRGRGRLS